MIDFKSTYSRDEILDFLKNSFIKDFQKDVRTVDVPEQKYIQEAYSLGYSPELELSVFEFLHEGGTEKRVTLTKEAFNVLRDSGSFKAIGIFYSKDTDDWRFSLMMATPVVNEKGKVKTILSNPKRYSFLLGPNAKVNTPTKFLITKGEIQNFEDLKERFSIEVVNKEFYKEISKLFIQLVGGKLGKGRSEEEYKALLRLPGVKDSSQTAQEFAVRLIGRLIFCWFLREKKNGSEESLMPHSLLSLEASKNHKNYYHDVLEPIFFKVLNVPLTSRKDEKFSSDPYDKIPYLNGGLFSPHDDDFYSTNDSKQENNKEEVVVPDKWLQELFEILETYNFTIDENSAFDEELSIDPEMLGRIFENLLAEINPETGESARKSTGSYYTPRVIVDYMVDESLYLYLKNKTEIEEEKLRSLISYDLDDDTYTPLTEGEKEKIITAIDELKILDPACGSGAFPMGALQKIVFILQQLDPNGQYWFKAQIKNVPVELRKNLEREHSEKNFDYIRKLGVIRRNIFGVDIQPIATEISRLRCFLTLIVDQKVDDTKDNRGIDPLPNLDFKFVTANSLISLPEKENPKETIGMFEDSIRINELKDIRDQFFNASNFERIELKDQFRKIQLEMSKYYNSVKSAGAELTEMLLSWDPFSHKMTEWFDPEWMFGIKEGFDIVTGNPPYLGDKKHKKTFKPILDTDWGAKYYKGQMDLFYYFFHLALFVSSQSGVISLITTNYYLTATAGKKLRKDINEKSSIIQLINFNELKIFKSATGQHNIITILQKPYEGESISRNIYCSKKGIASPTELESILSEADNETKYYQISNENLYDGKEYYIRINGAGNSTMTNIILDKICKGNPVLGKDRICKINAGIGVTISKINKTYIKNYPKLGLTQGEGVFVVPIEIAENLEKEKIKDFVKNSNISHYSYVLNEDKLIYLTWEDNIDVYPKIKKHLMKFKPILDDQILSYQEDFPWFALNRPRTKEIFESSCKIICPYRSSKNYFAFSSNPVYGSRDVLYIRPQDSRVDIKYLLALLNSKLYYFWLFYRGKRKGNILELVQKPLSEIPVKIINYDEQSKIINLVEQLLIMDYEDLEKKEKLIEEINSYIYKIYSITEKEIEIIEKLYDSA